MVDYRKQLNELQDKIQDLKLQEATLKSRKTDLEEELAKLHVKMSELGAKTPEELDAKIASLTNEIEESLGKCQQLLN